MLVKDLVPNVDLTDDDSFSREFDLSRKDQRVSLFFLSFFLLRFSPFYFFVLKTNNTLLLLCSVLSELHSNQTPNLFPWECDHVD